MLHLINGLGQAHVSSTGGTVEAPVCTVNFCGSSLGQDKGLVSWWHWTASQAVVRIVSVPQMVLGAFLPEPSLRDSQAAGITAALPQHPALEM